MRRGADVVHFWNHSANTARDTTASLMPRRERRAQERDEWIAIQCRPEATQIHLWSIIPDLTFPRWRGAAGFADLQMYIHSQAIRRLKASSQQINWTAMNQSCRWVHFMWPDTTQPMIWPKPIHYKEKNLDPTRRNAIKLTNFTAWCNKSYLTVL